jgi:hypothetical protein
MDNPAIFVDASMRFPWLQEVAREAESASIESLRAQLGTTVVTNDGFSDLANVVANTAGAETWLKPLVDANPDDLFAASLFAERMLVVAWDKRSHLRARYLTQEQITGFRETLIELEVFLQTQIARHPTHVSFWNSRITSAKGMGMGLSEVTRRYRRLEMLAPDYYEAALRHLSALLPKWYGTLEDALSFCRTKVAAAPIGSLMPGLIPEYYVSFYEEKTDQETVALLKRPDVHAELVAAGRDSVLAPNHIPCPETLSIHSNLALLLAKGGWYADAWPHFRALGPYPVKAGWRLLATPEEGYRDLFNASQKAGEA